MSARGLVFKCRFLKSQLIQNEVLYGSCGAIRWFLIRRGNVDLDVNTQNVVGRHREAAPTSRGKRLRAEPFHTASNGTNPAVTLISDPLHPGHFCGDASQATGTLYNSPAHLYTSTGPSKDTLFAFEIPRAKHSLHENCGSSGAKRTFTLCVPSYEHHCRTEEKAIPLAQGPHR